MDHIKDTISKSPILARLKAQLKEGGRRSEILSLLTSAQQSEVAGIDCKRSMYTVKLKRAYALYGIKAALKNSHLSIRVVIVPR